VRGSAARTGVLAGAPAPDVLHVVVGPRQHGVVIFAERLARLLGGEVRRPDPSAEPVPEPENGAAGRPAVALLQFTEQLYAPTTREAGDRFCRTVDGLGVPAVVVLHDLPDPADEAGRYRRRARTYARVVDAAGAVVLSSEHERARLAAAVGEPAARRAHVVPLPVDPVHVPGPLRPARGRDVAVLGFVFPGKGHHAALVAVAGLHPGATLTAVGRAGDGHHGLIADLTSTATRAGCRFEVTGFVPDEDLPAQLRAAGVPLVPSTVVSASGSLNSWLEAGRRPLVADSEYAREAARRMPGALQLYRPHELVDRMLEALREPERTWLSAAQAAAVGPVGSAQVAAAYRSVLREAASTSRDDRRPAHGPVVRLDRGRVAVPGNRWDLAPAGPWVAGSAPTVSVLVPYYADEPALHRLLAGLALQDYPRDRFEVVVADDGSPHPPRLPDPAGGDAGHRLRVVRQEDRGFRAAAARNLAASVAEGEVLCFLDADLVPEPGYLRAATSLPAVLPDALVVGRRRHADLSGWTPPEVRAWLTGEGAGPDELPPPEWLADGYTASRDLLDADRRSYRFMISAVLTVGAALFAELGGFDESFRSYGGEDWELAHRAWAAGAVFAHARDAVAWHDGPDWGARTDPRTRAEQKEVERRTLARLIPDPDERGPDPVPGSVLAVAGTLPVDAFEAGTATAPAPVAWTLVLSAWRSAGVDVEAPVHPVPEGSRRSALVHVALPVTAPEPGDLGLVERVVAAVRRAADGNVERQVVPLDGGQELVVTSLGRYRRARRWSAFG